MARYPFAIALFVVALVLGGCGDGSSDNEATDEETTELTCEGIVDRWIDIQQDVLDQLAELDARGASDDERADALSGTVAAMVENSRDATTTGCEAEIVAGAEAVCARLDELSAAEGAATQALERLFVPCNSGG